jgi:copper(I)-binding protein
MRTRFVHRLAIVALSACTVTAWAGDAPVVSDAWARATPPGVDVGAAYMVIQGGKQADRLVAASSARAAMVHLHTVEEQGGMAKMRAIDAVDVPAGQRVTLAPKSTHLMLMGLDSALVAGQTFVVTLSFAKSGEQSVTVTVKSATATDDHAHHQH